MEHAVGSTVAWKGCDRPSKPLSRSHQMRLLPILAAATIGVFAVTAVNAQSAQTQKGAGNPSGTQNMDTANKGNPNEPSAGQTTGMSSKAIHKKKRARKHHAM